MKFKMIALYSGVLANAILLAACGSGSGGVTSTPSEAAAAAAPAAAAGGAISGVAAKGILSKAIVTAYCGNSEAAADQLATGTTDAAGQYSLTWTIACAKPLKLVVTGDANTTMADEATGTNVTPPAGFKLRALVADPDTTTTKNITPLTDMAAAIAGTSATLSKTAASNAEAAIIKNVLGGDIGAYQATPLAPTAGAMATASADEKKLATLLTVISAFAQDSTTAAACGAVTGGNGAKIQCAIDAFVKQAIATVTSVSDAGYTVATSLPTTTPATMLSTTLTKITTATSAGTTSSLITAPATGATAVSSVITADTSGSAALLTTATASVNTASTSTAGTVVVAAASGLQAARDLFNSLKNDLLALSNGSGTGYLDQKVSAMHADWTTNANDSARGFTDNLSAIKGAVELAREAKIAAAAATWTVPGPLAANTVYRVTNSNVALETDGAGLPLRFLRSHADGRNCYVQVSELALGKAACYYSSGQLNVPLTATTFTGFFHAVEVAESATPGTYDWKDFMGSRTFNTTILFNNPTFYLINGNGKNIPITAQVVTSTQQTGTAVVAWNPAGEITTAKIKGNIQPLVTGQDYSTMDISGTSSSISATSEIVSLAGTVTNVKGTATSLTMELKTGSQLVHALTTITTPDHLISGKFITQIKTAAFQYDGTLSADSAIANLNGEFRATNGSFTGKISTLAGGTPTEFLSGTMGVSFANMAAYNPSIATSATNFLKNTATFSGKATNGSTTYEFTFIVDGSTFDQESVTLNYSRIGSQMVSVTATQSAANAITLTIRGSGNVNAVITNGSGDVKTGTTTVGSIANNTLTFTDGTYLLLGI